MIPQTREATPTEVYVCTIFHNYTVGQLYSSMHTKTVVTAGSLIGFFLSGAAVTLGVSSILLLSSKREAHSIRYYPLCTYTVTLLLLLVAVEILEFVNCDYDTVSFFWPVGKAKRYYFRTVKASFTTLLSVAVLTDGLLVWRCFLVQRVLGRGSPKWYNVFWVFPAYLFVLTIASGIVAVVTGDATLSSKTAIIALASNVALNIHATLFITTRLLLHRRMVIAFAQNKKLASQHIYIVGILLESAAVNLPVTIATAVGFGNQNDLSAVMLPIFAAGQALAAVLIIYQTTLNRVFNQRKEAEINRLLERREHGHISGNVEPSI